MKYIVILLFPFVIACEVVVDVDIPLKPSSITVHSTINPDSAFQVQLTASQNILSNNEFSAIPGATVNIYEGDALVETLLQNSSDVYEGLVKPLKGHTYTVEVSKDNYETVQASDNVPSSNIAIHSVSFSKNLKEYYNQEVYTMAIEFDDPDGENYYEIGLYGPQFTFDRSVNPPVITDTLLVQYYLSSEDPIFADTYRNSSGFWAFSDALVDGKRVKINFSIQLYQLVSVDEIEVTVVLREVSYDLYRYKQTANLQQSLDGDPFAEPVPVYNNVKNGYGVFGAYQQTTSTVTVHRED